MARKVIIGPAEVKLIKVAWVLKTRKRFDFAFVVL